MVFFSTQRKKCDFSFAHKIKRLQRFILTRGIVPFA